MSSTNTCDGGTQTLGGNRWFRRVCWLLATTVPIYLMLTVFMPPGFAGVYWMGLVMLLFLGLFVGLVVSEKSAIWNAVLAFLFWMPMVFVHLAEPGTETVRRGEVWRGVVAIFTLAAGHAAIQGAIRLARNSVHLGSRAQT